MTFSTTCTCTKQSFYHARCFQTWKKLGQTLLICEPRHDKNQQSECAPSEDSDQPGHPPSLIRVFAFRMKKPWALSYPLSAQRRSDQTGRMPRLIWVFAGRTLTLLVLSCRGSRSKSFCRPLPFYNPVSGMDMGNVSKTLYRSDWFRRILPSPSFARTQNLSL